MVIFPEKLNPNAQEILERAREDLSNSLGIELGVLKKINSFFNSEGGGVFIMFISAILLSVQGLFIQLANDDGLGFQIGELIFARCFSQLVVCSIYISATGTSWVGKPGIRLPVILRGFFRWSLYRSLVLCYNCFTLRRCNCSDKFTPHPHLFLFMAYSW